MFKCALSFSLGLVAPALAGIVSYEGNSFPENVGWERRDTHFTADRWLQDGWFFQRADIVDPGPPEVPQEDIYDYSLAPFEGVGTLFAEWRMETDGPREGIEACAPAVLTVSGRAGIFYHFTIAKDQVRFIHTDLSVLLADIEPGVPHTYRLELDEDEFYTWYLDGQVIDAGVAEGPYPTADSRVVFGARATGGTITARWDYIRFGVIPVNGSGDFDSDADIDVGDFYFFQECVSNSGPDDDAGPGCCFADIDDDTDVDLRDIAVFQTIFTGGD